MLELTRRALLLGSVSAAISVGFLSKSVALPLLRVSKDPTCGCCSGWVDHVRAAGFQTEVIESSDLAALKSRLGIPVALAACHTAEIDGYVIEGHVPAAVIKRLLSERPNAIGLSVSGMPVGSPGMEITGATNEPYGVILFGLTGQRRYARFLGDREL